MTTTGYNKKRKYTARSLLEWAEESQLVLSRRKSETEEDTHARAHNMQLLDELAKNLELAPDEELFGPEQELRALKFYTTDGSHKLFPTYGDLLTSHNDLADRGKGAGGIVFMQDKLKSIERISLRIIPATSTRGMTAYSWELLMQLIGLHLTRFYDPPLQGYSDCTSASAQINKTMRSYHNKLCTKDAGLVMSAAHRMTNVKLIPRQVLWSQEHPERRLKMGDTATEQQEAIAIADAVCEGKQAVLLGKQLPTIMHSLSLSHIFNELIPIGQWHLRRNDDRTVPVLDNIMSYQHRTQLKTYLKTRDDDREPYWQETSLALADQVNKPTGKSRWAAARRTLNLFDWLGHGTNIAKMYGNEPARQDLEAKCPHCGKEDNQQHCMLECSLPDFVRIRRLVRVTQDEVALKLLQKYNKDPTQRRLIQTMLHASWVDDKHTRRLWLGAWSTETLQAMLPPNILLNTDITMSTRTQYYKIIKKMTEPLLKAYREMLDLNIRATGPPQSRRQAADDDNYTANTHEDSHNVNDDQENQDGDSALSATDRLEMDALFTQTNNSSCMSLHTLDRFIQYNQYSISMAASSHREDDGAQ